MAERQIRITLRDKQTTGGSIPGSALFGEPFVNLYDGVLKFSGVTGGVFETTPQSGVFEVGSNLYNQRITNRLNINDNFIISGDTGLISTYAGATGSGLVGKFLSGTSQGLVLADIKDIADKADSYTTGATWSPNTLTLNLNNNRPSVNVVIDTFNSLTAVTIYSGATDVDTLFVKSVLGGSNVSMAGSSQYPIVNLVDSPSFNDIAFSGTATGGNLSANQLSGGTIYSGATNLYDIFVDSVNAGTNISIGGTASNPVVDVIDSPVFAGLVSATGFTDSSLTQGRVVYVGTGGRLVDEAGFEYNEATDTLSAGHAVFGIPGQTGTTLTVNGDILVMGDAISGFTSQLYIEDNFIELNYNPTADTSSTSLGAGWSIQDGSGVAGTDVFFDIRGTGATVSDRGFATNLYDIFIRESGTVSSPNGVRVLAEFDILDGGQY